MEDTMVEPGTVRVLQGTAQPWVWSGWSGWWRRDPRDKYQRRRTRLRVHEIELSNLRDWRLRTGPVSPPDVVAYAPNQIRHIIRWEAGVGSPGSIPTGPSGWPRDDGRIWRHSLAGIGGHISFDAYPTAGVSRAAPTGWWEGVGPALSLVAALLAAILLLMRAVEKCLNAYFFKLPITRQNSEEWSTPNVTATSLTARMTTDFITRPPSPSTLQPEQVVDLPPPYSECAESTTTLESRQKPNQEEPPPPYSACYVAYTNPKDGPPSVHFFTRQCQNLFANYEAGPSNVHDTGQGDENSSVSICMSDAEAPVENNVIESGTVGDGRIEDASVNEDTISATQVESDEEAKVTAFVPQDMHVVV